MVNVGVVSPDLVAEKWQKRVLYNLVGFNSIQDKYGEVRSLSLVEQVCTSFDEAREMDWAFFRYRDFVLWKEKDKKRKLWSWLVIVLICCVVFVIFIFALFFLGKTCFCDRKREAVAGEPGTEGADATERETEMQPVVTYL